MAKITKFGTITENESGDIVLDGFAFDMEFESDGEGSELLMLVIDRLKSELDGGVIEVHEI